MSIDPAGEYWYPLLRSNGVLYLRPDQVKVIRVLRRYAVKQGLKIRQSKTKGSAITTVYLVDPTTGDIIKEEN